MKDGGGRARCPTVPLTDSYTRGCETILSILTSDRLAPVARQHIASLFVPVAVSRVRMESSQGHIFSMISVWFVLLHRAKRGETVPSFGTTLTFAVKSASQMHFVICFPAVICQIKCKERRLFHISYHVGNYLDGSHLISHRDSHEVLVR